MSNKLKLIDFAAGNGLTAEETGLGNFEPSLTRQEFADECDINVIMARYEKTGVISHVIERAPMYVDWTAQPSSLMDALAIMGDADAAFMSLPAKVRREFDNDPLQFVDYAADPANLDQMREWGLAPPAEPADAPDGASAAPPAPPPAKPTGDAPKPDAGPNS
jgi:phage internal scaffolding protein